MNAVVLPEPCAEEATERWPQSRMIGWLVVGSMGSKASNLGAPYQVGLQGFVPWSMMSKKTRLAVVGLQGITSLRASLSRQHTTQDEDGQEARP